MKILEKFKSKKSLNEDNNNFGIPITDGNFYLTKEILQAQDELNKSTIPKQIEKTFDNGNDHYDIYRLLLFQGNYFINRFNILIEDKNIQEKVMQAMWGGFLYGRGGIWKVDENHILAFAVSSITFDNFGNMVTLSIIPAKFFINQQSYKDKFSNKIIMKVDPAFFDQIAIYQWNTFGQSAYFRLLPFLNQFKYWIELISSQKYLHLTKIIYEVNDPATLTSELDQFKNPRKPFLAFLSTHSKNGGKLKNKMDVLEVSKAFTSQLKEDYMLWKSEFYELLGREFLQDPKAERKIEAEVQQSNASFASSEYDYYLQVAKFNDALKKLNIEGEVGNYEIGKDEISNQNEENDFENEEENF